MKFFDKRIVMILIGLSVMLLAGNVTAADVNTSQDSSKQVLSDYLPKTSGQNVAGSLVLAQLGSLGVSEPIAGTLYCNADNQCVTSAGNPVAGYKCCGGTPVANNVSCPKS